MQFMTDLKKFITDIIDKNEDVILKLDANEVLEPVGVPVKTTSITALQRDCGLQDIYEYQHETLRDTIKKKHHKIDHMLILSALLSAVIHSGFGEILESDHRTSFVNFESRVILGGEIPDLNNTANRKLHTKYIKRTMKYKEEIKAESIRRNLFQALGELHRIFKIDPTTKLLKKYNALNKEATQIMLKAEDNCVSKFRYTTP